MTASKVCILGGTGFVGRHIAVRLSQQGVQTRILTRNREQHRETLLVLPGVELFETNIYDPATLETHFRGRDAVINLVGILNEHKRGDFHIAHSELPRLVANACVKVGMPRLLHMSALGADPAGPSAYQRSKGIGQEAVHQAGKDSAGLLMVTIFRPSVIFGEGDSFFNRFADLLRRIPFFLPLAKPNAKMQPVWVENVTDAYVEALSNPETYGQIYDLCGPKVYTLRDLVAYTQSLIGTNKAIIGLPDWVAMTQAMVREKLPGQLLTRDNLLSLSVDNICTGSCFPAIFRLQARSLESVVPSYLGREVSKR